MSALLPIAIILILAVGVLWHRGRQFGALARDGVAIMGTVERKFRPGAGGPGSRGHRVAFTYRGPDGREYRRAASITQQKWSVLEEGGPIELVCLPGNPGTSAPAWLVEAAREALARK